jgi:glycosyltransferase involved in cell wall biosynthesis
MRTSVIVATYEWPAALDVVLRALSEQSTTDFDVVVADDGSGEETSRIVERWRGAFELEHVWQRNEGFLKARLLNRAVLTAGGDYLLFLDGDCVPRRGFVSAVQKSALPGWFVASKRLHLSESATRRVLSGAWPVWRWSAAHWALRAPGELVRKHGGQRNRPGALVAVRDRRRPWRSESGDYRPPYNGYGYALGVSRDDLDRVNGFDMRFNGWDGEDVDIADRLRVAGLRCGWPGPPATVMHLWHEYRKRAAAPPERVAGAFEAPLGLRQLREELAL